MNSTGCVRFFHEIFMLAEPKQTQVWIADSTMIIKSSLLTFQRPFANSV